MEGTRQSQLVVMRPTAVFYAFLMANLGKDNLPEYDLLHVDNTCFFMPFFQKEGDTIDYVHSYYSKYFSYEIKRWLGKNAENPIINEWDNFVSCFYLSYHSCILANTDMKETDKKCALIVHPKTGLLSSLCEKENLRVTELQLSQLKENGSVILFGYNSLEDIATFAIENYRQILNIEKKRLSISSFPEIKTYEQFSRLYSLSIHQHIINELPVMEGER